MKNRIILTVCVAACVLQAYSQPPQKQSLPVNEPNYNRPKLFADLPDRIDVNPAHFTSLFQMPVGKPADVAISPGFILSGQVVSRSESKSALSVVVGASNRPGARFIFTQVTDENNRIKYLGRIISFRHDDSYELMSDNNQYYFKKKGIYDLVSE